MILILVHVPRNAGLVRNLAIIIFMLSKKKKVHLILQIPVTSTCSNGPCNTFWGDRVSKNIDKNFFLFALFEFCVFFWTIISHLFIRRFIFTLRMTYLKMCAGVPYPQSYVAKDSLQFKHCSHMERLQSRQLECIWHIQKTMRRELQKWKKAVSVGKSISGQGQHSSAIIRKHLNYYIGQ